MIGIAVGAVMAVSACGDDTGGTAATSLGTAPPESTAPVEPAGAEPFPDQNCCHVEMVEAGTYALPEWLGPALTVEVDGELGVINEERAGYFVLGAGDNGTASPSRGVTLLAVPAGTSADEVIDGIRTGVDADRPVGTLHFDESESSRRVAGFPAVETSASSDPDPTNDGDANADIPPGAADLQALEPFVAPAFQMTTLTPGEDLRFTAIETDSGVLLAVTEAPPAEFRALRVIVDRVLASLTPV